MVVVIVIAAATVAAVVVTAVVATVTVILGFPLATNHNYSALVVLAKKTHGMSQQVENLRFRCETNPQQPNPAKRQRLAAKVETSRIDQC